MKRVKEGPCSSCSRELFIENRTKWLCVECNHYRKHGESLQTTMIRKQEEYRKRSLQKQRLKESQNKDKPKKLYVIKQSTKKQNTQLSLLSSLKSNIRKKALDEERYYCWGCGYGSQNLDCSHILSVRHRKDLELDEENINLFCRTCHNKWEFNDIEQQLELLTFEKDLEYIKLHDRTRFNRFLIKLQELRQLYEQKQMIDVNESSIQKLKRIVENQYFLDC